ncbi:MAG TPA: hypothetical protein VMV19_11990 [Xanthobacteraceae bacterium]|nr:hypothetical protein [Xanthobacteraceae bacterium]
MADEMNDPEMSYRRGFAQGAFAIFETIEHLLPVRERSIMYAWLSGEVAKWRKEAMRGRAGREDGKVTSACHPPIERLRQLRAE